MPVISEEYQTLVLDDIRSFEGLSHPVRACLLERLLVRRLSLARLHPNPTDEFCDPNIGPSYDTVLKYVHAWGETKHPHEELEKGKLCVEKMSAGGYMLLDGHHRWLAAHRLGMKRFPVTVMNATPVERIVKAMNRSDRRMCVSFDLDEVLLTKPGTPEAEPKAPPAVLRTLPGAMRRNAPLLIRELRDMGFDVWVYTAGFVPESTMKRMFSFYRFRTDGIVNGLRNREHRAALRKAFSENYDVSLHVDTKSVVWVNNRTREYDIVDIEAHRGEWSAQVMRTVRALPPVQAHLAQTGGKA